MTPAASVPAPASISLFDHACRTLTILGLLGLGNACSDRDFNFSQYPGFAEWYAQNPQSNALPTNEEQGLLARYQPRFYLPPGHEGPIDFYRDYIAQGQLVDGDGKLISEEVTQTLLNTHKLDPALVFTHSPAGNTTSPTVYGRIAAEPLDWPGCTTPISLTFLSYHLVFRSSGLPAGVPSWQAFPLGLLIDLNDWHQLDHYTAVTITLAPGNHRDLVPMAVTFQQHNYQRTYLLGADRGPGRLSLPGDDRIGVDIAIGSNELYPHEVEPTVRRAISFMDPDGARYLIADSKAPWLAADDRTNPAVAVDPSLSFLSPDDAFYIFQGWLGERRHLPGRDGPPGADYNTLPPMKPLVHQMALSYWHEGDLDWLELYSDLLKHGWPNRIDPTAFIEKMAMDLDPVC